jgi:hypothetical protein
VRLLRWLWRRSGRGRKWKKRFARRMRSRMTAVVRRPARLEPRASPAFRRPTSGGRPLPHPLAHHGLGPVRGDLQGAGEDPRRRACPRRRRLELPDFHVQRLLLAAPCAPTAATSTPVEEVRSGRWRATGAVGVVASHVVQFVAQWHQAPAPVAFGQRGPSPCTNALASLTRQRSP